MWDKVLDAIRDVFQLDKRVDQQREEIDETKADLKELRTTVGEMGEALRYLNHQQIRDRERADARYENLALRL